MADVFARQLSVVQETVDVRVNEAVDMIRVVATSAEERFRQISADSAEKYVAMETIQTELERLRAELLNFAETQLVTMGSSTTGASTTMHGEVRELHRHLPDTLSHDATLQNNTSLEKLLRDLQRGQDELRLGYDELRLGLRERRWEQPESMEAWCQTQILQRVDELCSEQWRQEGIVCEVYELRKELDVMRESQTSQVDERFRDRYAHRQDELSTELLKQRAELDTLHLQLDNVAQAEARSKLALETAIVREREERFQFAREVAHQCKVEFPNRFLQEECRKEPTILGSVTLGRMFGGESD